MSVLIKGMEMPKVGRILIVFPSGRVLEVSADETQDIFEEAQAFPVPPHGRLIDEKDICEKIHPLIENPYCYNRMQIISETLWHCLQIVRDAPTIIEAEESEA